MPAPKLSLRSLFAIVAFLALVTMLFVTRSELNRKSVELNKLKIETGFDADVESERILVVLKTNWIEAPREIYFENTSRRNFTFSISDSGIEGDELAISFSVHYVGCVDVKNAFEHDDTSGTGQLIAVKVSYYDLMSKKTKRTETTYTLYSGREIIAYQQDGASVTLRPVPDVQ